MLSSPENRWSELESILDQALDVQPGERPALIATACGGDAQLEEHVRELVDAATLAEAKPDLAASGLFPDVFDAALTRLDGSTAMPGGLRIGAYRIVESLGAGGMGEVYLAERADGHFEQRVALKVLSGLGFNAARNDRFRRERQILAGLQHENIALLLDGGVTADGRPFFVMQYVDGVPVTDFCTEHDMERDKRIVLFLQACDALQYAHGQGVVHRDLKPANLLVSEGDAGHPQLSVLDFGIARMAGMVDLTRTGDVLGTPAYMAPEQARGEAEAVDRRADVFALGVVLYQLVCGQRPFDGGTPGETLAAIVRADPPSPRALVPSLPRDLETVILNCLEPSPERRYVSVRALRADLERYLAGEPIAAGTRPPIRRLTHWVRRRPFLSALLMSALLAVFVAGAMGLRERAMVRQGADLASRYGQLAEEIAATMRFEHLLDLHDTAPARQRLAERLSRLETELERVPAVTRPTAYLAVGRGYLSLGRLERALPLLDEAWTAGLMAPAAALTLAEAEVQRARRDRATAELLVDPSLRSAQLEEIVSRSRARALDLRGLATGATERGELLAAQIAFLEGDHARASKLAESAVSASPWLYEAFLLRGEIALSEYHSARQAGDVPGVIDALERAEPDWRRAAEIAPSDPIPRLQLCRLATLEVELRLHDVAGFGDDAAARGVVACEAAQRADSTSPAAAVAESTLRVAYARDLSRRGEDPFDEIDRAIEAASRGAGLSSDEGSAHRRLGDAWVFRAEFERERGLDPSASLAAGSEALMRAVRLAPEDAGVWNSLGLLRWEEVLRAQRQGLDLRPAARLAIDAFSRAVEIEPRYAYAWGNLGTMYNWVAGAATQDGEDALPLLREAESALRRSLEIYPAYVTARNNLGNVSHNRGEVYLSRDEDARAAFRNAMEAFEEVAASKPDWAFPRFNRARSGIALSLARLRQGEDPAADLDSARSALSAGLELRSDLVDAHLLAAELEVMEARRALAVGADPVAAFEAARRALGTARQLDPAAGEEQERDLLSLRDDASSLDRSAPSREVGPE